MVRKKIVLLTSIILLSLMLIPASAMADWEDEEESGSYSYSESWSYSDDSAEEEAGSYSYGVSSWGSSDDDYSSYSSSYYNSDGSGSYSYGASWSNSDDSAEEEAGSYSYGVSWGSSDDFNTNMNIDPNSNGVTSGSTGVVPIYPTSSGSGTTSEYVNSGTTSEYVETWYIDYPYYIWTYPVSSGSSSTSGYCALYVDSVPSGVYVTVDGYYYGYCGSGNSIITYLRPGYHKVVVNKLGYYPWYDEFYISSSDSSITVYPRLTSEVSYGYLSASSSPSGADIYVDGYYRGTTPDTLTLGSGDHKVALYKAGYAIYSTTVNICDSAISTLSAQLQSDSNSGYITVVANPAGAAVYVDNNYVASTTQANNVLNLGPYNPGTVHTVTVAASGYTPQSQQVTIAAGKTQSLTFNLASDGTQSTAKAGTISISSNPNGANVYIDNTYAGVTPVTLTNIKPGSHILKITANGYADYQETISLSAGQTMQKSVSLSKSSSPSQGVTTPLPLAGILVGLLGAAVVFGMRRQH